MSAPPKGGVLHCLGSFSIAGRVSRPLRGATRDRRPCAPHTRDISTHAPRAGRDLRGAETSSTMPQFQPTRPVRGATASAGKIGGSKAISTHAPRAGRDLDETERGANGFDFNPCAPCGARQQTCTKIPGGISFGLQKLCTPKNQNRKKCSFSFSASAFLSAEAVRTSRRFLCACSSHRYMRRTPSGSYDALTPKCSILLWYLFPS